MGEATYYFKAVFDTDENVKKGFKEIKRYLALSNKAENYWQSHRRDSKNLTQMKVKFKELFKWMSRTDGDNGLAGSFIDTTMQHELKIFYPDNMSRFEVRFSATVWHFDDWEHLVKFVKSLKGCTKAGYLSDEWKEPDYFNMIE